MNNQKQKIVAFIPARSGSKRIKDKNIYPLDNHPLLAYTICTAVESQIFDSIICATDSSKYAEIAEYYGAEVPFLRDIKISDDKSADLDWLSWAVKLLNSKGRNFDIFSILRPTSPLRKVSTLNRAFSEFLSSENIDSLRAVEKCHQHPGKMWVIRGSLMQPLLPFQNDGIPWHSSQYDSLPEIYVQNASLEIAWTKTLLNQQSISGEMVKPFITDSFEGFDINYPEDIYLLEELVKSKKVKLPNIKKLSYFDI